MSETFTGSCHCGAVRFEVELDLTEGLFVQCNCSLCSSKNRGVAVVLASNFELCDGEKELSTYRWNTKHEAHNFCGKCGTHTHHTLADPPKRIGINLGCVHNLQTDDLTIVKGDGAALPLVP